MEFKPGMTLRQLLDELQSHTTEDYTEDKLLDTEIKVEVMSTGGTYKVTAVIKEANIVTEQRFSSKQDRAVPLKKDGAPTIMLKTSLVP